jgi:signal transduction histidine kinase
MGVWHSYKKKIERNILKETETPIKDLSYWKDRLFTNILIYLLPVSLLALVPGVIMSFVGKIPLLALFDILTVGFFLALALFPGLSLLARKIALIILLYLLSVILLIFLGSFGPGLLYLLALTVIISLIFPLRIAMWSVACNLVVCILFVILIEMNLLPETITRVYTMGSWIAVSSNLIFFCTVIIVSIDLLFTGLQDTIFKEAQLQQQLRDGNIKLEKTLIKIEAKTEELEQFAYIASHDLQEPLKTISSLIDNLNKYYKNQLEGNGAKYLQFLAQSSERMQALIFGLLEYSRIGKERHLELVDCNAVVKGVKDDLAALIKETDAEIIIEPLPALYGYKIELVQLFLNLINNGLKFRKENIRPVIKIGLKETNYQYIFFVEDNGIGFDEKFGNKIFVIFQRLHLRTKYPGTGIGLAQCKKIVELHGGKIWVNSKPGKGSIFYFTILKDL